MIRSIFAALLLAQGFSIGAATHAKTSGCDLYLTSIFNGSETSDDAAQAFVRLVKYYLDQPVDKQNKTELLKKITETDQFINPFNGSYGSLELQLERAVQKILASASDFDQQWLHIQKSIVDLDKNFQIESKDRENKSDETSVVFNPRILQSLDLPGSSFGTPTWFRSKDGNQYLTFNVDGKQLKLYVFENESLRLIDERQLDRNAAAAPMLHVTADGREILTSHQWNLDVLGGSTIDFFELINGKLQPLRTNLSGSTVIQTFWLTDEDKDHLVTLDPYGDLNSYEFIGGQFRLKDKLQVTNFMIDNAHLTWHQSPNGNKYLVVGVNLIRQTPALHLYKYSNGHFKHLDTRFCPNSIRNRPQWHTDKINHEDYLFANIGPDSIHVYKLKNDRLNILGSEDLELWDSSNPEPPTWHQSPGGKEWAVSGSAKKGFAFEFIDEKIIKIEFDFDELSPASSPNWHLDLDQYQVLTFSSNKRLAFYREHDDQLNFVGELTFKSSISITSGPNRSMWIESSDGRSYGAVATHDAIHLISIFDRIKAESRAQSGAR